MTLFISLRKSQEEFNYTNMPEENLTSTNDSEIYIIPEEFYGAVSKPVKKKSSVAEKSSPVAVSSKQFAPAFPFGKVIFSSPKVFIGVIAAVLIMVTGIFSYYYIHQAQVARQKLLEAEQIKNSAVITPGVSAPATSTVENIVQTEPVIEQATSTPTISVQFSGLAVFPFKNYAPAEDTDNDSLTNQEESLYGTNPSKPDSDDDGFSDSLEILSLYNPIGFKPVRLLDSGKVATYFNPNFGYSIFYPVQWIAQALDSNAEEVIFSSDTGEFVEVLAVDNVLKLKVEDWYLAQSPGVSAADLKIIKTKEGVEGILSPDGLTAYLPFEDRIFVINYDIGIKTEINFLTTLKMMVGSFKAQGEIENLSPEITTSTVENFNTTSSNP
ncbi:MAG: hypothetical protein UT86_C0002G0040 [Candidatus Magasanikbacteria bacterium GW2011_GWC2_40_17]|uniref:Uncharacterized protein n=1 Tax=Candidatus Magasanikbacteria bacterium GW2011_GWA2_42_32 TaxID=1619039 RepID=A0A0G1A779_9BACT|nr:MAG: hypothetical protein UT86_C0002G0040 [Candidatus Magasanikbacteria bacterium GW2011_GWC2_40_17]KKS56875.1 MAG: hypothetical protein UV20_C0005G0040 [Candidatus Magasanikbacteria bacterium GW2011_GWA2_42_32]OGH85659.1 MAG: hypothetical protein A2294_00165 [Candidatus Magasanikbacteria bacterium RIFOXYB2_FULL_38_10]